MYYDPIDIDLILMMDTTGSMTKNIRSAKKDAWRVIDEFSKNSYVRTLRIGFIAYRDHQDTYSYVTKSLPLTYDYTEIEQFINQLRVEVGPDEPEAIAVAMRDAFNIFADSPVEGGKILVWYCDAPPHGRKYNCGLRDDYPDGDPSGIDFDTEVSNLVEMNVLIYAVPFGKMISNRCLRKNLNRWTNNQAYAPAKRMDSFVFTDHILRAAVTECILRREVYQCISRGMSHEETEAHIMGLGLSKRDIVIERAGKSIRTEERGVTREEIKKTTLTVETTYMRLGQSPAQAQPTRPGPTTGLSIVIKCISPVNTLIGRFSLGLGETVSFGRNNLPIDIPGRQVISRTHFTLTRSRDGTGVIVMDVSKNGLHVNDVKLTKNVPRVFQLPMTLTLAGAVKLHIK